jgi:hypothetical protein
MDLQVKYFQWVNPHPEHAHFNKEDFQRYDMEPVLHPMPELERPTSAGQSQKRFWLFQRTFVDVDSLAPVLQQAFEAAGIQPITS